jgi:diguanylate cyclase (GGDEF)-like protein
MQVSFALNTILGSLLVLTTIVADYARRFNTDSFQRAVFLGIVGCFMGAMVCNLGQLSLEGLPGETVFAVLYVSLTLYYILTCAAYYQIFIFIDYLVYKDLRRSRFIGLGAGIVNGLHLLLLLVNVRYPLYFYISSGENLFFRGSAYIIHLVICYVPVLMGVINALLSPKAFRKLQLGLLLLFMAGASIGSSIDLALNDTMLFWPCFVAVLLFSYFFIIRRDLRLDTLTGIGNRYSFNEFVDKLAKQEASRPSRGGGQETWAVVMIDMDHFKEINDTLGHAEGDNALQDMARIIREHIRQGDLAARYGGDEFVIACRGAGDTGQLIARIQAAMDAHNAQNIRPYRLEMSSGSGVYRSGGGQSIQQFMEEIDSRMYQNKSARQERRSTDLWQPAMERGQ